MSLALETTFWLATLAVAYTYAGYPLLLLLLQRLRPAPRVKKASISPRVSLVIVAYNEEQQLEAKLRDCLALDYPAEALEILVVSDGSTDRTETIARSFAPQGVRLLSVPGPHGKPAALNQAVPHCEGEILVLADSRQEFATDALRQLVSNFANPTVGAVSGELYLASPTGSAVEGVGLYWKYEKLLRVTESHVDSTVGVTGAIYAVRRHLFEPLDPRTILDDVMIPMQAVVAGYRVLFEPGARAYDRLSEDPRHEYRRKVRTLAGNYQLLLLRPSLLDPFRNRLFWQFVSHKLLRLLVPWCLLALLLTSGGLTLLGGTSFYAGILVAQLAFYLCAAMGAVRGGRLFSFPFSFVLLNLAAGAALFRFLTGRASAAWKRAHP